MRIRPIISFFETEEVMVTSTSDSKRLLFVCTGAGFGGHEIMTLRLIEELSKVEQLKVDILGTPGQRLMQVAPSGLLKEWRPGVKALVGNVRQVLRARYGTCIFASGSIKDKFFLALLFKLLRQRVVIYTPLTDPFSDMGYTAGKLQDFFFRTFYAKVPDGWITITSGQAAQMRKWLGVTQPIFLLPNTIASRIESMASAFRIDRPIDDALRVLVLGRLDANQKGLDALMDRIERDFASLRGQVRFSIVGDGPYGAELKSRLDRRPELGEVIALHPWQAAEVAFKGCDVLFLPSRFEGVPLVMLEAMALGIPVVASRLPGTQSFLPNELLFSPNDIVDGFEILATLRDAERRSAFSQLVKKAYENKASNAQFRNSALVLLQSLQRLMTA